LLLKVFKSLINATAKQAASDVAKIGGFINFLVAGQSLHGVGKLDIFTAVEKPVPVAFGVLFD